jgi:hypothetical protein
VSARKRSPSWWKAFSIGSKGSTTLARIATSTSVWKGLGQRPSGTACQGEPIRQADTAGGQVRHRHAVLGERAGLVAAQHGGGAERLDGVDAPGEHALLRQPARAEGREHGQHHRVFLGQHGHGQRDAGQQRLQPVTLRQAVNEHQRQAQGQRQQGQVAHQPGRLLLQR